VTEPSRPRRGATLRDSGARSASGNVAGRSKTLLELARLQALRLKSHRLVPSRPLRDAREAAAFIEARQMVMATAQTSLPSLAEVIAGRSLTGSWMAHPEAGRIYRILRQLIRSGVISVPLVLGKETLIDSSLGPAVERIATDRQRIAKVRMKLTPLAQRLLAAVEARGQVRMDDWGVPTQGARPARRLLERQLLVVGSSFHTESGYHTSLVVPWTTSEISKRFSKAATRLSWAQAVDALILAGVRSAVLAPEREVRRWFVVDATGIDDLLTQEKLRRMADARTVYLTTGRARATIRKPVRGSRSKDHRIP